MSQEVAKILFAGPVGAGKTSAIACLSEIPVVSTDVDATDVLSLLGGSAAIASMTLDADGSAIEGDMGVLTRLREETGENYYNMNCQLAVVYIQAMNVLQEFLQVDNLRVVVGGHSKRGRSATVAAATAGSAAAQCTVETLLPERGIQTREFPAGSSPEVVEKICAELEVPFLALADWPAWGSALFIDEGGNFEFRQDRAACRFR